MPGRSYSAASQYRYGFNGKENDKDISEGGQDYGMRISDTRLGRFLSVDPITNDYPELTPYQFASNCPIAGVDQDGLEFSPAQIQTIKDNATRLANAVSSTMIPLTAGIADEFKNANLLGIPDHLFGFLNTNHVNDYEGNEQIAYLVGRSLGAMAAIQQAAIQIPGGLAGAAATSETVVGGVAGLAVAGHGVTVGAIAAADLVWALNKLLTLNVNLQQQPTTSTSAGNSSQNNSAHNTPSANSNGAGPKANNGNAKNHGKTNHNDKIDDRVKDLKKDPDVLDIRKNQVQVDVHGNKVGTNRPDVQYNKYDPKTNTWEHHTVEYDNVPANSTKHGKKIKANDPNASVELNIL